MGGLPISMGLPVWLLLKSNDPHWNVSNCNGGRMGAGGEDSRKFLKSRLLNLREVPLLISRGHSKKATFVILLCFLILPNFFRMFLLDMFRVKAHS